MRAVIGDVHGCYKTLLALIQQVRDKYPDIQFSLVGDLIDRGPSSAQVVQYVIDNNIDCVRGNHEQMMIDAWYEQGAWQVWMMNGGVQTDYSYNCDQILMKAHIEWMKDLPLYLEYKDIKNEQGRYLVVSHSTVGKVWDWSPERRIALKDQYEQSIMWERHDFEDHEDIYNVIGHTPQKEPKVKSFYANIDTGAVFTPRGIEPNPPYGYMTCLIFPSMEIFTQVNIDNTLDT